MSGVGQVGLQNEGSIGCVGGACVGVVVGTTGLPAAVNCKSSGYESVRFLFKENLAAKEYCFLLNARAGDQFQ